MNTAPMPSELRTANVLPMAEGLSPLCALKTSYLEFLLETAEVLYLCAGDTVFHRGVCDFRHVYLLSGRVRLQFASGYSEQVNARDLLHPLVDEMPRPCEAVADTDCTLLVVDSERLDRILSWSQIAQYLMAQLCAERDLDEDIAWIKTVLGSNLFIKVPPVNAALIINKMKPELVMAGEVIVRQGEIGSCCYFIKEGSAKVTVHHTEYAAPTDLAEIGPGRCFGEDALVYETLRNASVTMTSDGVLMRLDKAAFKLLLAEPKIDEVDEEQFHALADNSPEFIDVRTQEEYERGHLALSANVPLSLLALKQRLLRRDVTYVLYCDTGRRSRAAAFLLAEQGFRAVALRGGLIGAGMQYQLVADASYILREGRAERC